MSESRAAPLAGVLFALLLVVGFAVNPDADFMPPQADVVAHLQQGPMRVMVSAYLSLLAAGALLWFSASTHEAVLARNGENRLALVALTGGAFAAALVAVGAVSTFAAAERVWTHGAIEPGAAAALIDVSGIAVGNGAPIGLAVLIGAWGLVAIRASGRAAWIGRISIVIALGLASPFGWAVLVAAVAWIAVIGISIYRSHSDRRVLVTAR